MNNIQRSASLFLVKTFYSTLLTILLLFLPEMNYPFAPIQTTLIGSLAIGMPSMALAFTPNRDRIQGSFFRNVIVKAVPGALTIFLSLSALFLFQPLLRLSHAELSTIAVIVTGSAAIMVLYTICRPLNLLRAALLATVAVAFVLCNFLADGFFELAPLAPMRRRAGPVRRTPALGAGQTGGVYSAQIRIITSVRPVASLPFHRKQTIHQPSSFWRRISFPVPKRRGVGIPADAAIARRRRHRKAVRAAGRGPFFGGENNQKGHPLSL